MARKPTKPAKRAKPAQPVKSAKPAKPAKSAKSAIAADVTALLDDLREVIAWLGRDGLKQADESGDLQDYETEGTSIDELASAYWTGLGHQRMLADLIARLPVSIHTAKVLALIRDGYPLYEASFLAPASSIDVTVLPEVTVGGKAYTLATMLDKAAVKRAGALMTKRRR
jgi:hypothetical protein